MSFSNSGKTTSCSGPSILCLMSLQTRTKSTKPLIKAFLIAGNYKWFHTAPIFLAFKLGNGPKRYLQNFAENKICVSHTCYDYLMFCRKF